LEDALWIIFGILFWSPVLISIFRMLKQKELTAKYPHNNQPQNDHSNNKLEALREESVPQLSQGEYAVKESDWIVRGPELLKHYAMDGILNDSSTLELIFEITFSRSNVIPELIDPHINIKMTPNAPEIEGNSVLLFQISDSLELTEDKWYPAIAGANNSGSVVFLISDKLGADFAYSVLLLGSEFRLGLATYDGELLINLRLPNNNNLKAYAEEARSQAKTVEY